jgi:phage terminase small subunit
MTQETHEQIVKRLKAKARRLKKKLSPNQAAFAQNYLATRNATRSYLEAYPSCTNEKSAAELGSRTLRNVKVEQYMDCEMEILQEKTMIKPETMLREESKIIFRDIRQLFDNDTLIPPSELPDEIMAVIDGIEVKTQTRGRGDDAVTYTTYKYKMADKGAALGRMERHLGMYDKDSLDMNPGGRPIKIEDMSDNEIARRVAFMFHKTLKEQENET